MPSLDDEQFERYLKQFQPLAPEPMPIRAERRTPRRVPAFAMWAAAAAIVVVAAVLAVQHRAKATYSLRPGTSAGLEQIRIAPVLTIRDADAWLGQASSFKAAVDDMAWRSQPAPMSSGKQSALAVLSKENFKL